MGVRDGDGICVFVGVLGRTFDFDCWHCITSLVGWRFGIGMIVVLLFEL
jgi:hypothetical protein